MLRVLAFVLLPTLLLVACDSKDTDTDTGSSPGTGPDGGTSDAGTFSADEDTDGFGDPDRELVACGEP